jgi:hypothetical protein
MHVSTDAMDQCSNDFCNMDDTTRLLCAFHMLEGSTHVPVHREPRFTSSIEPIYNCVQISRGAVKTELPSGYNFGSLTDTGRALMWDDIYFRKRNRRRIT